MNLAMQTPFSLRIFVVDDNPDGLRIVIPDWIDKALVFLHTPLPQTGVHFFG